MAKKFICSQCGQTFEAASMPDKCPICGADASKITEVKSKGINTNGNVYTFCYATVMVVIVAFLLAFVASALKPMQDANVARDKKNQILTSLNVTGLKGDAIDKKYAEVITEELQEQDRTVYVATVNGATKYVLPVKGRGLWGGLWGYISVDEDKQHVYGTYFDHESETAGLGARIKERWFQEQFNGKPIFDETGEVVLTVVKKGQSKAETEIDGVTGATLTSNGVGAMVTEGLKQYKEFLNK
ncbi:MAG: FMN-binding protein [Bacteroidaceae bacterium]|nr:FMN-binding protein [Bacteroidaceae bacterium]